ncbi:hypothetical protein CCP4SC76_3980006 [Gammaproteobacteria bacterium]
MQSIRDYTTSPQRAKAIPAPAGYMYGDFFDWEPEDFGEPQEINPQEEPKEITMPEMLTNAQVWLEEYQGHLSDLEEENIMEEAERAEFFRFGSSGGF